jgi:hypothetical protein
MLMEEALCTGIWELPLPFYYWRDYCLLETVFFVFVFFSNIFQHFPAWYMPLWFAHNDITACIAFI